MQKKVDFPEMGFRQKQNSVPLLKSESEVDFILFWLAQQERFIPD